MNKKLHYIKNMIRDLVPASDKREADILSILGVIVDELERDEVTIKFKKLDPEAILPTVAHEGEDVGMDLYALKTVTIRAGKSAVVPVGVAADIPEGYWLKVENRSGMGFKHGLRVHPGIIDPSYRGELGVKIFNLNDNKFSSYTIEKGERIAQLVVYKAYFPRIEETDTLSETSRGADGFGSTGRF